MSKPVVAVAMSGGVDSAVAAYLALEQGYAVTGINLRLDEKAADETLYECCEMLRIPLIEWDCRKSFHEKVIVESARIYAAGRTPNPCCECNKNLKFAELFAAAGECGIEKVWTGHYANLAADPAGNIWLSRGRDSGKDQSYFLYRLTQAELRRVGFPLGDLVKSEVRQIAAAAGLPCAERPDSQDACFQVAGECCGETLRRLSDMPQRRGKFIYNGKTVGFHDGIHRYTIGQRQGLNVALGVPAYIAKIDPASGNIMLTTVSDELLTEKFMVKRLSWCCGKLPENSEDLTVRIRYRSPGIHCRISPASDGRLQVFPETALRAVTPGQAAVFYRGNILLGGGEIDGDCDV